MHTKNTGLSNHCWIRTFGWGENLMFPCITFISSLKGGAKVYSMLIQFYLALASEDKSHVFFLFVTRFSIQEVASEIYLPESVYIAGTWTLDLWISGSLTSSSLYYYATYFLYCSIQFWMTSAHIWFLLIQSSTPLNGDRSPVRDGYVDKGAKKEMVPGSPCRSDASSHASTPSHKHTEVTNTLRWWRIP